MTEYALIFLLSIVVYYMDYRRTWTDKTSEYNGYGSIWAVLRGRSKEPMQCRVFVPWLCDLFGETKISYELIKFVGVVFALLSAHLLFQSGLATLLLVMFLCSTTMYDYADGYWEIGFFATAFYCIGISGAWEWYIVAMVSFLGGLNRETAIFIPIAILASGLWMLGLVSLAAVGLGIVIPRMKYGRVDRYCPLIMIRENIRRLEQGFAWPALPEYLLFFLFCAMVGVMTVLAWPLSGLEWVMLCMTGALIPPIIWTEMRVFQPAMLAFIPMAMRGFN